MAALAIIAFLVGIVVGYMFGKGAKTVIIKNNKNGRII